jgi:hypothetical protein
MGFVGLCPAQSILSQEAGRSRGIPTQGDAGEDGGGTALAGTGA